MESIQTRPAIAAAYIRVSTDSQTELSPDAQLRVILEAACSDGFSIPKEYIFTEKKGISGRKADNRPEFQRMISLAKSQSPSPFCRLYLWKFSRFARNQDESTFYKSVLRKKCGVEIVSVSEPIAEGMFGRLIETIIEWFDEYYSFNLSGEVLRGMKEKALRHGYQLPPCLGYNATGGGGPHVINEREYAIAEFIHSYYHEGHDLSSVARECNRLGYLTKRGNPFQRRTIEGILKNKFYIGIVEWNGIEFSGSHETRPSITSVFPDNQLRLAREYHPGKRRDSSSCKHWLSGLLICGFCGSSLCANQSASGKGHTDFFQCWKYSKGLHPGSCSLSVHKAERLVQSSLKQILGKSSSQFEYKEPSSASAPAMDTAINNSLKQLRLKELRIKQAYENGIDSLDEYQERKARLMLEKENLLKYLYPTSAASSESSKAAFPTSVPNRAASVPNLLKAIHSPVSLFSHPDLPSELIGASLRRILKKIVYNRERNILEFYYYI